MAKKVHNLFPDDFQATAAETTAETTTGETETTAKPTRAKSSLHKTSLYIHPAVHDKLREIAYHERKKVHDLISEGLDLVLKDRGYASTKEIAGTGSK